MAKSLKKAAHELEVDLENFELFFETPAAGTWRKMRFLEHFFRGQQRTARDGINYFFWDFVQWYGPTSAPWYWDHAHDPHPDWLR